MKKVFTSIFILFFSLFLIGCSKKTSFFTNKQLENFGLNGLIAPDNASNYYNKSNKNMLFCYMKVSKDDDVRKFVLSVIEKLQNEEIYKVYGYAKGDDMFKKERKIYLSQNIDDYLINTKNYSEDSVTFNSYTIYYALEDVEKDHIMYVLDITSYTEENTIYLSDYNLMISVVGKSFSNYTIIDE